MSENFEFAALGAARNYRAALLEHFLPYLKGGVLEIGAGVGQLTTALLHVKSVTALTCVEPSPEFCQSFRRNFPDVTLIEGTAKSLPPTLGADAIVSVNVLEHIERDEEELGSYKKMLANSRGYLCLFVPAGPEIYAPLDKEFGHFRRYTRPELRRKLEGQGFSIVRLHYFNAIGYLAWWFSFCFLKQRRFNPGAVRLFDRAIFPVMHWLEKTVAYPPLGQSLLAIARG